MTVLIKVILIILFALIFLSLGSALFFLVHDRDGPRRTVKALTWRIALSVILFIVLMIAFTMGWIKPHSIM